MERKSTRRSSGRKRSDSNDVQQGEKKRKVKRGKWYEASIASEKEGIALTNLKKIGHRENASRVGASSPYDGFTFYLLPQAGVPAIDDMAVSLADFCRLCADIDRVRKSKYTEELSESCADIFSDYVGGPPSKEAIENAIKEDWVILPAHLEEINKANAAAKMKARKQKEEGESSNHNTQASGSSSSSSADASGPNTRASSGRSQSNTDASNDDCLSTSLSSGRVICVGLKSVKVEEGAKLHPSYCLNAFDFCKGGFRAKNCLLTPEGPVDDATMNENEEWKRAGDCWQCVKCISKKKGVTKSRHPILFNNMTDQDESSALPNTSKAIERIKRLYTATEDITAFLELSEVRELMVLLRTRDCLCLDLGDRNKLFSCPGYQYTGSVPMDKRSVATSITESYSHCSQIGVVKQRTDNVLLCQECARMREQHSRNEDRRDKHYESQIRHDSRTPVATLSGQQIAERMKRLNNQRKVTNAKIDRLTAKLEKSRNLIMKPRADDVCESDPHSIFCDAVEGMLTDITGADDTGVKTFRSNIERMLKEILMEGIRQEGKDPTSDDIDKTRVSEFVDFITNQMCNVSKQMSGKENQVEFSSLEMQLWYSHYCSSASNYRESRDLSPLCMPSPSTMKKQRATHKVNDGKCTKFYEGRRMQRGKDRPTEVGIVMGDEMKPKRGMYWNTSSLDIVGMANDLLDTKAILKRLMSEEDEEVVEAESIQQWKYVNVLTGESFVCEYFLNDGSLTGETLMRQFDHVCLSLELVGSQVLGLVMDAGGNNARFYTINRKGEDLGDEPWLSEDQVTTLCLVDPSRNIYLMHCLTHLLKAQRNHLFSSWSEGTKWFKDADGVPFGRALIEKLYQQDLLRSSQNQAPRTRITERVVYPSKYTVMAVGDAKIVSEDKTLEEAEIMISKTLGITDADLSKRAAAKIAKYPRKYTRDGDANLSQYHGYRLARVDCLIEVAKSIPGHEDPVDKDSLVSSLRSDLSTLKYLTVVGALFNELLMDRFERFTNGNTAEYTSYVEGLMEYYGDWRSGQLRCKETEDADWEESFMEVPSYRFLRQGVCGFVHFANHVVKKYGGKPDFDGVKVMDGNSSKLECVFSRQRGSNHDSTGTYGTGIATGTAKANQTAARRNPMYGTHGLDDEKDGGMLVSGSSGTRLFNQMKKQLDAQMEEWRNSWKLKASTPRDSQRFALFDEREWLRRIAPKYVSKFGPGTALAKMPVGRLLSKMRAGKLSRSYAATIMSMPGFQHHARLAMGNADTKAWFDALGAVDDDLFDKACQKIQLQFLRFTAEALTGGKDNVQTFELRVREYIVGNEFNEFCSDLLPEPLQSCRIGNVVLVTCLSDLHRDWMEEAAIDLASEANVGEEDKTTLSIDIQRDEIHRFVGSGLRRAKSKFEKQILMNAVGKRAQALSTARDALKVIEAMFFTKAEAINDEEYIAKGFYPQSFQHRDHGACLLLKAEYFDWASRLMDSTRNSLTRRSKNLFKKDAIKVAWTKIERDDALRVIFDTFFLFNDSVTVCNEGIDAAYKKITKYVFHSFSGWKFKHLMDRARDKAGDTGNVSFRTKMQMNSTGGASSKKLSGDELAQFTKEEHRKMVGEATDKLEKNGIDSLTKFEIAAILHCKYDVYYYYKTPNRNKLRRKLRERLESKTTEGDENGDVAAQMNV